MRKRLQVHFPDQWQQIYVAALLRLLREPRFKRLQLHFENSILSHVFPKLSFTASDNAAMLRTLGKKRQAISCVPSSKNQPLLTAKSTVSGWFLSH